MSNDKTMPEKLIDFSNDVLEKISSPSSRAGSTVERVGKMVESGVDPDVIALQMTKNSPNETTYTAADVKTCNNIYKDAKTKVVITSEQARSLINDQKNESSSGDEVLV
ncbi:hypothetical protein [Xenorhabdus szentirmaii]|uniref:hypothetical protein n=1 Tax=Xenorhabdus szentirmaii TaxID=290112 RepID=UPI0019BD7FE3|nr:hypothetical protein [Xenorhabdus sp. 38]MBD2779896.1 hypothetical protein [Xenorhabdus sp. 38]